MFFKEGPVNLLSICRMAIIAVCLPSTSLQILYLMDNLNFLRYSGVFALVTRFLNQAEQESPKAAAVMYLGAAKEIALHKDPVL